MKTNKHFPNNTVDQKMRETFSNDPKSGGQRDSELQVRLEFLIVIIR
ncbi:hypothetical protein [Brevibacillus dissolubilis]|nr:hypothetical protein [Brevibacillus dissolubilis]